MTERSLIPKEPAFMVKAAESIEGLMEYAKIFLKSGLAPKHFEGKPEAVVIAVQQGLSIGMTSIQALQQIVVINGTPAIKGDGAKALIMGSGLCASWKQEESGSIEAEDYEVTVSSVRRDSGDTLTVSFSVADAKRAELWISAQAAKQKSSLKYSPWYKFPKRMLAYRAIGFLARDLYPDVLQGTRTEAEAEDMHNNKEDVLTPSGDSTIKTQEPANEAIAAALKTVSKVKVKIPADVEEAEVVETEEAAVEEVNEEPAPEPTQTEDERVSSMVKQQDKIEKANPEPHRELDLATQIYTKTYLESKDRKIDELVEIAKAKGADPDDYIGDHSKKKAYRLIIRAQSGTLGEIEKHKIPK